MTKFPKIKFEDNQIHSTFSDGQRTLEEIFEYNHYHDRLDITLTDHVDKDTAWFDQYIQKIKALQKKYQNFKAQIGCEVKILDDGTLNTTPAIIKKSEVVLGSVHHFKNIKTLSVKELMEEEFRLTKLLAQNKTIDILAHPFSMGWRFFKANPPLSYVSEIYNLCLKNGIKFEYNKKNSPEIVKKFVYEKVAEGKKNNFSFGSDMHDQCSELGNSAFDVAPTVNILVTGAGAGVGQSIIKSIKLSGHKTSLITVDNSPLAAGLYRGDRAYLVPKYQEKEYLPRLVQICKKENVDLIFIGTDVELEILASHKRRIEKETGAKIIVSNLRSVQIADDKWKTAEFLKKNGFPYARSHLSSASSGLAKLKFPVIVKPRIGARSIGFKVVKNIDELRNELTGNNGLVIQEHLSDENQEYTCGALFLNGQNYGVIPAQRWLRNGDTYKASFGHDLKLEKFIAEVGKKLKINGPCNFQLRKTKRGPVIFEINCRFSGTTGAASYLGFNGANALIQNLIFGRKPQYLDFKEAQMLRYWNEVFASPADVDTLSKNKKVDNLKSDLNIF